MHNLLEHPKTIALRILVIDAETGIELSDASVDVKGTYVTPATTSRDDEGERGAREHEFKLRMKTSEEGVAVASLGWKKEYPWLRGFDDIEKAQEIEVRHPGYKFSRVNLPFSRFLDVGQRSNQTVQEPRIFKAFKEAWSEECGRSDVKFCVMDFGKNFPDLNDRNSSSSRKEFFTSIAQKQWGDLYSAPKNMFRTTPRSIAGPYFVYLVEISMERVKISESDDTEGSSGPSTKDGKSKNSLPELSGPITPTGNGDLIWARLSERAYYFLAHHRFVWAADSPMGGCMLAECA